VAGRNVSPLQALRPRELKVLTLKRLNPLAALADQAWLSLLSFSISIAFIWGARKDEYAYYLLLVAPIMLVQSIQNAIGNSPLATLLPVADDLSKPILKQTAASLHIYLALAGAILGGPGLFLYAKWAALDIPWLLPVGFSLAIVGTIAREAQRSFAYVQGEGLRALAGDVVYGFVLLAGIAAAILGYQLTAGIVLSVIGVAGMSPLLTSLLTFRGPRIHPEAMRQFWSCSRWALPSVVMTWINLSAYPYFAARALGLSAVADIGASRLFLMPVGLAMTAWSNWYRPRISSWRAAGELCAIQQLTRTSLIAGLVSLSLVALFISVAYAHIEPLLGARYTGLKPLVLMWLLFFAFSLARNVYMATLMTDANGYRILHHITCVGLVLSVPGFVLFSESGAIWVVGVLCAVELVQLVLVRGQAKAYWKDAALTTCASCSK
jgi:O-antigen/teichoic acid export membrane protein